MNGHFAPNSARPDKDAIDPKPTRAAEQERAAKTRRLLPAESYDTIQVPICHDF